MCQKHVIFVLYLRERMVFLMKEIYLHTINVEEKTASIVFDGKQFLVRFPTEIAEMKKIKKGDKIKFKMTAPKEPIPLEEGELLIEYVRL